MIHLNYLQGNISFLRSCPKECLMVTRFFRNNAGFCTTLWCIDFVQQKKKNDLFWF